MITLTRFFYAEDRTAGVMEYSGHKWWTIERPWLANAKSISCIPEGDYQLTRYDSPSFGERTWQVSGAKGRTFIAIHAANYAKELEGCIAMGAKLLPNVKSIGHSKDAVEEFYALTAAHDTLLIRIQKGAVEGVMEALGAD